MSAKKPYTERRYPKRGSSRKKKNHAKRERQNKKLREAAKSTPELRASKHKDNKTLVLQYKKTHHCVDCGESNPFLLEFDHTNVDSKGDGIDKSFAIGSCYRTSEQALRAELAKCDVRCVSCHRIKTLYEKGSYRASGLRLELLMSIEDYFDRIMGVGLSPDWYSTAEYDILEHDQ